jgi:hypothetical protein
MVRSIIEFPDRSGVNWPGKSRNLFDVERGPIECSQLERLRPIRSRVVQKCVSTGPMTFRHDVILDRYSDEQAVVVHSVQCVSG